MNSHPAIAMAYNVKLHLSNTSLCIHQNAVCDPQAFKAQSMVVLADVLSSLYPVFICALSVGVLSVINYRPAKREAFHIQIIICRQRA